MVFFFWWEPSADVFLGTSTVLTLSDIPVCNEELSLLSLTEIGDGKHSKVLWFGDVYLSFLAGVDVTAKPDRLNCGMVLDDLLFWWEPRVGIWHDCLRTGVVGCTSKTGFGFSLELTGTLLLS